LLFLVDIFKECMYRLLKQSVVIFLCSWFLTACASREVEFVATHPPTSEAVSVDDEEMFDKEAFLQQFQDAEVDSAPDSLRVDTQRLDYMEELSFEYEGPLYDQSDQESGTVRMTLAESTFH